MARSRNIKPGFFMNELLAEAPFEARLLFIGLWTLADREGRLEDRPKRIKAELFPFDSFDADPMLARLSADGFLVRYEVGGQKFIQIENFVKHQDPHYKEKASVIPAVPGRDDLILASGVTRTQRARIYERDGYKCMCCGATEGLCIDHVLPVSRGGTSDDDNLQTLCMSCNTKKGNKLDGEEKNSRQRRVNVASNMNQRNAASPSDSLIPDSLIPDSIENPPTPRKRGSAGADGFNEFWLAYPRKTAKPAALKAFCKLAPSAELLDDLLQAIARQKHWPAWCKDDGQFIPHPATWINGRRWEDQAQAPPAVPFESAKTRAARERVFAMTGGILGRPPTQQTEVFDAATNRLTALG